MPGDDEDAVSNGERRLGLGSLSAAAQQLPVLRGEVGVVGARGAPRGFAECGPQGRVSLGGATGSALVRRLVVAGADAGRALGKRLISTPISATSTSGVR